jgi:hypothetical protein
MKFRFCVLIVCGWLVLLAGRSLSAQPERASVCCIDPSECDTGEKCCDPIPLGQAPCSDEKPGICMSFCTIMATPSVQPR